MNTPRDSIDVVIKAYESNQALARFNGESASRSQSWGVAVWSALIAFSVSNAEQLILHAALVVLLIVFIVDMGYRRVQYAFIAKSIELERVINKYLLSGEVDLSADLFTTVVKVPKVSSATEQLELKRWLFWLPYLILLFANIALIVIG
ncbi:hypothetical protein JY456_04325 [Stenotrophomonas maltophilia]|nr:hypothetical protein [Stenotrophomonas maltophilia]